MEGSNRSLAGLGVLYKHFSNAKKRVRSYEGLAGLCVLYKHPSDAKSAAKNATL